jgi:hypothetical protein
MTKTFCTQLYRPRLQKKIYHMYIRNSFQLIFAYGFGIWSLTPLSTIFQLFHGGQFYWWRKSSYPKKTTDLTQVTGKLDLSLVINVHIITQLFLCYFVIHAALLYCKYRSRMKMGAVVVVNVW